METGNVKILIVDDEEDVSNLIQGYIPDEYETEWVPSGEAALEAVDDTYDIVFLDRMMDRISGEEVAEEIAERGLDVKVAIISAKSIDWDILGLEIDAYIEKPASAQQVREVTEDMLQRSDYVEEIQEIFALIERRKVIANKMPRSELQNNEEYAEICDEIESLRKELLQGDRHPNNTQGEVALLRELTSNASTEE